MGSLNHQEIGISMEIQDEPSYVNILLLGESGAGKSTFINSFINYITYGDFDTALENPLVYLIPAQFHITDETDDEVKEVKVGNDNNERPEEIGQAVTQSCRSYVFPYRNGRKLRFIDTPGVGDPRGIGKDYENMENFLYFIAQFKTISAFIILLQSNTTRLTTSYEYTIKEILIRLDRKVAENMVFVFTHARGSCFKPGDSKAILKQFLNNLQKKLNIAIPFEKKNTFCVDNECFRFLVASQVGIKLCEGKQSYKTSWDASEKEYERLLAYITGVERDYGLKAHDLKTTLSINEARKMIILISKPLADITELISNNQNLLETLIRDSNKLNDKVKTLEGKLRLPVVKYKRVEQVEPVTVCTGPYCKQVTKVANQQFVIYSQKCHNPCYLRNVEPEIIGPAELAYCAAIDRSTEHCTQCKCHYRCHMHIYYEIEAYEGEEEDPAVRTELSETKSNCDEIKMKRDACEQKIKQYKYELETIRKGMAYFALFLKQHSLVPYNDAYEKYLQVLKANASGDSKLKKKYERLLLEYYQQKCIIELHQRFNGTVVVEMSLKKIEDIMKGLFVLKNSGETLMELYETQFKVANILIQRQEKKYEPKIKSTKWLKIMT